MLKIFPINFIRMKCKKAVKFNSCLSKAKIHLFGISVIFLIATSI